MIKRALIGFIIGATLTVLIILGFGIENHALAFIIGVGCGGTSTGIAFSI